MEHFEHRRFLLIPAVGLGMVLGLITADALRSPGPGGGVASADFLQVAGVIGGLYLILTVFVFRVTKPAFGLSPAQFRLGWIGAFLLGGLGAPVISELVYRWEATVPGAR